MKHKAKVDFWMLITIAMSALFAVFLVYPIFSLFFSAFRSSTTGELTLANFLTFFLKRHYIQGLFNSLRIAVAVTASAILIGTPIAYIMTMYRFPGKKVIEAFIVISMLSPPFIGAYSWILLLGRSGIVTKLFASLGLTAPTIYGMGGIIFVMTLKLYPFIYMYLSGAFKKLDASLLEAAESMGARPISRIFHTVMPLVLPTLLAGGLMIFMNAMADFGTPMLIGEGVQVMTTMIYREYIGEVRGSANFAAALATIMALITSGLFLAQRWLSNRRTYATSSIRPIEQKELSGWKKVISALFIYIVVALSMLPHVMVIYTSFFKADSSMYKTAFTLENYIKTFSTLSKPIFNTFRFGIIAIVCVIILSMLLAYTSTRKKNVLTKAIDIITMFPYILPGAVLGITLLMAFGKQPLMLIGSPAIIVIAFIIRRLPYTLRSSTAILYQISPAVEEASISLGCPPVRTFLKITARLMLPGVFSGAILSWVTIINELSASMLLYTGVTATMSVTVYQQILRTNFGSAAALSTILTLTTVISLLVFFKLSGSTEVAA